MRHVRTATQVRLQQTKPVFRTVAYNRVGLLFGTVLSAVLPAIVAAFTYFAAQDPAVFPWKVTIVGGLFVLLTSVPTLILLSRFWLRVQFQEDGILMRSLRRGTEFVPWSDLDQVIRGTNHGKSDHRFTRILLSGKRDILIWDDDHFDGEALAKDLAERIDQPVKRLP